MMAHPPADAHAVTTQRVRESLIREGASPTERRQCYPLIPRRPMTQAEATAALSLAAATVLINGQGARP
jgi:hypothetical protein